VVPSLVRVALHQPFMGMRFKSAVPADVAALNKIG